MTNKLTAQIASLPDRENVVYEIYCGADQVAEISNEPEEGFRIEIFNCPSGGGWVFDFDDFQKIIDQAKRNII